MSSINITIFGLIFILLLIFVYFSKKRINIIENKVYSMLIIISLISSSVEIVSYILVISGVDANSLIYNLVLKLLFECFLAWLFAFTLYFVILTIKDKNKINEGFIYKALGILIVFVLIISSLPIEINDQGGLLLPTGIGVNAIYILCGLCIVCMVYLLFKNIKNLKIKKYWPLFIILIVFSIVVVIQKTIPDVLLINPALVFITFLMYFTIENPDIKMIEQLNIARDTAEKANEAKTDFLSNMSHEIRTPLNAIVGFSNLLLEDKTVPDSAKEEVKDIVMSADNLLEIVNGILDISKIEANKLEIVNTEYVFSKMCNELVALSIGRLGDKPIEFKTSFDPSIPKVLYGDVSRIKQICVNILTNAIKYTKEGWIEFKISGVIKNNVCRLIISVEDTGIGIKKENIDKLFNKFERLDLEDNITIEGTGLGLAITKKLVELMNGKIVVQSVFGKGSKFTVSIDQRIVKNPTIKLEDSPEPVEEIKTHNKKVLIVDDNKINLKVAERLLESYGIDTESVESGAAALEKIQNGEKYDMILLDDMMPKMSGVETLKKLKEIPGFKIITIALTANALTGMREKYLQDGFDDYLAKPINKDELNRIINKYLNDD
ncbi:MAG TPA: response regulator [Candidatus Onthocola stercorigallinarum]|nr:response regulator [Candidatus Onthocola stercorigallinarum]